MSQSLLRQFFQITQLVKFQLIEPRLFRTNKSTKKAIFVSTNFLLSECWVFGESLHLSLLKHCGSILQCALTNGLFILRPKKTNLCYQIFELDMHRKNFVLITWLYLCWDLRATKKFQNNHFRVSANASASENVPKQK